MKSGERIFVAALFLALATAAATIIFQIFDRFGWRIAMVSTLGGCWLVGMIALGVTDIVNMYFEARAKKKDRS